MENITETVVTAVQLITRNDSNGNSRRIFLGIDKAGHVVVVNSDSYNDPAWIKALHNKGTWEVTVTVSPSEYRRWKKMEVVLGG